VFHVKHFRSVNLAVVAPVTGANGADAEACADTLSVHGCAERALPPQSADSYAAQIVAPPMQPGSPRLCCSTISKTRLAEAPRQIHHLR
jgi:hypothetical protein